MSYIVVNIMLSRYVLEELGLCQFYKMPPPKRRVALIEMFLEMFGFLLEFWDFLEFFGRIRIVSVL